jgi:hypothetical protein
VNAIKKGNTFLTSGPVVEFQVDGKMPGEKVQLAAPGTVTLRGQVWSSTPITLVRVYHNGKVWKDLSVPRKSTDFQFSEQARVPSSGWFSLVVESEELPPATADMFAQAVTNAVRVYVGQGKIRSRESAEYFLRWIERLRVEIADLSLWRSEGERARTYRELDEAVRIYKERAKEAE